jgi:hypothetical protein
MDVFVEIPSELFNTFFEKEYLNHNQNTFFHTPFHKLSEFKKIYANQLLENYYGIHYVGLNSESNTYKFTIINKKLYSIAKLKFGI